MFDKILKNKASKVVLVLGSRKNPLLHLDEICKEKLLVLYPEVAEVPDIDCIKKATYIPLTNEGLPIKVIKDFLEGEPFKIVIFAIPFEHVTMKWALNLRIAGISDIFFVNQKTPYKYSFSKILFCKTKAAVKNRISSFLLRNHTRFAPAAIQIKTFFINYIEKSDNRTIKRIYERISLQIPAALYAIKDSPPRDLSASSEKDLVITHFIGTLGPGGAERQLCNLMYGLKKEGFKNLEVITYCPLEGSDAHYLGRLQKDGIKASAVDFSENFYEDIPGIQEIPSNIRRIVAGIYRKLEANPPDILHIWLDYTNVTGALAGLLLRIPKIILSTRNVSPIHFPRFHHFWFRSYYRFFTQCSNIHFINNSHNGALDYAKWLECSNDIFDVILNGVDFSEIKHADVDDKLNFRKEINISEDTPLVCGIFRLSPEKRPLFFAKVAACVIKKNPLVRFLHAGEGPMENALRNCVKKIGIEDKFYFLGRRKDIPLIMASCNALLLTSEFEGTPNVLLESQWMGCPVVATNAGGVGDCVLDKQTGFVHDINDSAEKIANSLLCIINNKELSQQFINAGPPFIHDQFGLNKMIKESVKVYEKLLNKETEN